MKVSTQKTAQRNNKGEVTGIVYTLITSDFYTFIMSDGEFGKILNQTTYQRLPSKIKGLFN